jgi:hypothetical protein
MAQYADYSYYQTMYFGTDVAESDFPALMGKASAFIDRETFGRISGEPEDCVKQAACALVDCLHAWGGTDGVSSESVGEYSVSYNVGHGGHSASVRDRMYKILRDYLGNTGLLYRGVC